MAQVKFLKGNQVSFDALTQYTVGAFYLAEDTNRLYYGRGTDTAVLLNSTVKTVASIEELTLISRDWSAADKESHVNDFYYITGANILAIWSKQTSSDATQTSYSWVQINPDNNTVTTELNFSASDITNGVELKLIALDQNGNTTTTTAGTFSIVGEGTAHVSKTGNTIKVKGEEYSLSSTVNSSEKTATIALTSDVNTTGTKVYLKGGNNVTLSKDSDAILIETQDTKISDTGSTFTLGSDGKLTLALVDQNSNVILNKETSAISYTVDNQTFYPGSTITNVYSKDQIDQKIKDLNGVTYRGTVGSASSLTALPTTGVQIGDMYMVAGGLQNAPIVTTDGTVSTTNSLLQGDLLIAISNTGEENSDGKIESTDLRWTYIPSSGGTETDTTYTFTVDEAANRLVIQSSDYSSQSGIILTAGTNMSVSSEKDTNISGLKTTISHGEVAHSNVTATAVEGANAVTAITGVEVSAQGHVTKVTSQTFNLTSYTLNADAGVSVTNNAAEVSTVLTDTNSNVLGTSKFKLTSNTLNLTASDNAVNVELEWGTF